MARAGDNSVCAKLYALWIISFTIRLARLTGLTSAAFLIFNRVIGTGCVSHRLLQHNAGLHLTMHRIFATPSVILRSSGSVGLSLMMWLLGATVAACGTAVYIELGTVSLLHQSNLTAVPAYIDVFVPPRVFRTAAERRTI